MERGNGDWIGARHRLRSLVLIGVTRTRQTDHLCLEPGRNIAAAIASCGREVGAPAVGESAATPSRVP